MISKVYKVLEFIGALILIINVIIIIIYAVWFWWGYDLLGNLKDALPFILIGAALIAILVVFLKNIDL